MPVNESEFYATGMSLPPDVRQQVALRLLESVDPDEAFDAAVDTWLRSDVAASYDAVTDDLGRVVPAEDVRKHFGQKWAARP